MEKKYKAFYQVSLYGHFGRDRTGFSRPAAKRRRQ